MRFVVVLLLAAAAGTAAHTADPPADARAAQAALMAKKLEHAKKLLEGLALDELDKVQKSAEELLAVSRKAEFTAARKTREYELQTNDFRRALETVVQKSKAKSLDGATLGYVDMTLACVRCHQAARETRVGLAGPGAPAGAGGR